MTRRCRLNLAVASSPKTTTFTRTHHLTPCPLPLTAFTPLPLNTRPLTVRQYT
jgi:hypothetical protein